MNLHYETFATGGPSFDAFGITQQVGDDIVAVPSRERLRYPIVGQINKVYQVRWLNGCAWLTCGHYHGYLKKAVACRDRILKYDNAKRAHIYQYLSCGRVPSSVWRQYAKGDSNGHQSCNR